jgi:hypothetical protein
MITVLCVVVLVGLSATIALSAGRHPRYQRKLETLAGVLLIAGFGLLGYLLRFIVDQF